MKETRKEPREWLSPDAPKWLSFFGSSDFRVGKNRVVLVPAT
jgi:hypothetical protein